MTPTAVYTYMPASNSVGRETVVFDNVGMALAILGGTETRRMALAGDGTPTIARTAPGLRQVQSCDPIIALGRAAHTILADFQKRTLIASELDVSGDRSLPDEIADDISRLIWSCVNTSKLVALGDGAWRSIQMLPLDDRCFYSMPPLRLASTMGPLATDSVLIVNHDRDESAARDLATFLADHIANVACAGVTATPSSSSAPDPCWADEAFVHVHIGHHTMAAEELRLIDSWYSRRLALQLLPRRQRHSAAPNDVLMIEDEVNGFVCHTPEKVATCLEELRADRVLQGKMIDAGLRTVAPLAQKWMAIAEELLAR